MAEKKYDSTNSNNKKITNFFRHIYYYLFVICIIPCLWYIYDLKIDTIATILALIALVITIDIARIQDEQLSKIGFETKETTINLKTNSVLQENEDNFFLRKNEHTEYKLICPLILIKKPLPLINAADSYAMYVITSHLGVVG